MKKAIPRLTKTDKVNHIKCPRGTWFEVSEVVGKMKQPRRSLDKLVYHGLLDRQYDSDTGVPAYFKK